MNSVDSRTQSQRNFHALMCSTCERPRRSVDFRRSVLVRSAGAFAWSASMVGSSQLHLSTECVPPLGNGTLV